MIEFIFLILFLVDAGVHIFGIIKENSKFIIISKPLLMPLLALYFIFGTLALNNFDLLIVAGLLSGFFGDIFY